MSEKPSVDRSARGDRNRARWPGVVFSLLVPGLGLVRAGKIGRGFCWFASLYLGALLFAVIFASEKIPLVVGLAALFLLMAASIWMLIDSCRPGRMTPWLWISFTLVFIASVPLPPPGSLVAKNFKLPSSAMEPTLLGTREGNTPDHVVVDRMSYHFNEPRRGDLIVFDTSKIRGIPRYENVDQNHFVKRLVGLPGETIEIRDGAIYADGRLLSEVDGIPPIAYEAKSGSTSGSATFELVEQEYFALGDNTSNSWDSRHWGNLPASAIIGKITKIYYPFSRIGVPSYPSAKEAP
jgi:signal peptidase I